MTISKESLKKDSTIIDSNDSTFMLTTLDNPFSPFTQFDEWYALDVFKGYHTSSYIARIIKTSDELSLLDQHLAYQQAIDEILHYNLLGIYIKVTKEGFKDRSKEVSI